MFIQLLQLEPDFVRDGLHLFRVGPGTNDKKVREGGNSRQIQDLDVSGFFRLGRSYRRQPGRLGILHGLGFVRKYILVIYYLCQETLPQ